MIGWLVTASFLGTLLAIISTWLLAKYKVLRYIEDFQDGKCPVCSNVMAAKVSLNDEKRAENFFDAWTKELGSLKNDSKVRRLFGRSTGERKSLIQALAKEFSEARAVPGLIPEIYPDPISSVNSYYGSIWVPGKTPVYLTKETAEFLMPVLESYTSTAVKESEGQAS